MKGILGKVSGIMTAAALLAGPVLPVGIHAAGAAFMAAPSFVAEFTSNGGGAAGGSHVAASNDFFYVSGTGTSQFKATDGTFWSGAGNSGGVARDSAGKLWIANGSAGQANLYSVEPDGFYVPETAINLSHALPSGYSGYVVNTSHIAVTTVSGEERLYHEWQVVNQGPGFSCKYIFVTPYRTSDGTAYADILVQGGCSAGQAEPGPMAAADGKVYVAALYGNLNAGYVKNIIDGGAIGLNFSGLTSTMVPSGIAVDSAGQLWATWASQNKVSVYTAPASATYTEVNPLFEMTSFSGGPGAFTSPQALAFNPSESRLYVTQSGSTLAFEAVTTPTPTPTPTETPTPTGTPTPTPTPSEYKNIVTLSLQTIGNGPASFSPIEDADVRVFNVADPAFTAAYGAGFGQWKSRLDEIFAASIADVSDCETDENGTCTAFKSAPGSYLTIARFSDTDAGKTVYISKQESPADFNADKEAFVDLKIQKKFKKGHFDGYGPAGQVVVLEGTVASSGSGNMLFAVLAVAIGLGFGIYIRPHLKK